jgi:pimeloyl-ACP methyl ester carboxylesterase
VGNSRGRHRAKRTRKVIPVAGVTGIAAAAGAAVMGLTPSLSVSPQLTAEGTVWYLRGTEIGDNPSDPQYEDFIDRMMTGAVVGPTSPKQKVDYPASFFPVSSGYINDPTFDASVGEGLANLEGKDVETGDVIFGFSQGAVVASEYKREHPDANVTYVLVENPDRPNGGILERFKGLSIPILGVTANGATPPNQANDVDGPTIVDISRQYDGWSDFPAYPLNVVADANAIAGIYYLHGKTQSEVDQGDLDAAEAAGGIYYQHDEATKTTYYLIATDRLPLLMPFTGIVPEPILDAADAPLRAVVELGYDRSDYGKPTTAGIAPAVNPVTVATQLTDATAQGAKTGLDESGVSTPNILPANTSRASSSATLTNLSAGRHAAPVGDSRTTELKLPTFAANPTKLGAVTKPTTASANPLSPKSLADNVSHALGIKKDKPKDTSGADNAG